MDQAVLDTCEKFAIPPALIDIFLQKTRKEMMKEAIVKAPTAPDQPDGAVVSMRRMSVDVLRIVPSADAHFITSDRSCLVRPILRRGGDVLMPIAGHVAVRLSRPEDSPGALHSIGASTALGINQRIFDAALRYVAGPSRDSLCALRDDC